MSRLSTSSASLRVDRVVARAAARRSPGTSAASPTRGRAAGSTGRRRPSSRRASCRSASPEYSNGPRWTWAFVAVVRKSDRLTFARGCTMPCPDVAAVAARVKRRHELLRRAGLALIASTTCVAGAGERPGGVGREATTTRSLPGHASRSAASSDRRVAELGGDVVAALVAPRARGEDDRPAGSRRVRPACCRDGVVRRPSSPAPGAGSRWSCSAA